MREAKVVASEIARCHFVVHYPLDGSVRRGMNERSVFLCRKHALVFAWPCDSWNGKTCISSLVCWRTVQYVCPLVGLHWCHSHTFSWRGRASCVTYCSVTLDCMQSVQRSGTQDRIVNWETNPCKTVVKQNLLRLEDTLPEYRSGSETPLSCCFKCYRHIAPLLCPQIIQL